MLDPSTHAKPLRRPFVVIERLPDSLIPSRQVQLPVPEDLDTPPSPRSPKTKSSPVAAPQTEVKLSRVPTNTETALKKDKLLPVLKLKRLPIPGHLVREATQRALLLREAAQKVQRQLRDVLPPKWRKDKVQLNAPPAPPRPHPAAKDPSARSERRVRIVTPLPGPPPEASRTSPSRRPVEPGEKSKPRRPSPPSTPPPTPASADRERSPLSRVDAHTDRPLPTGDVELVEVPLTSPTEKTFYGRSLVRRGGFRGALHLRRSPPSVQSPNAAAKREEVLERLKRKELKSSSSDSDATAGANYVKVLKHRKNDDVTRNDPHDVIDEGQS
ncbi:unnamed protein product [Sphagnum tenellum]